MTVHRGADPKTKKPVAGPREGVDYWADCACGWKTVMLTYRAAMLQDQNHKCPEGQ